MPVTIADALSERELDVIKLTARGLPMDEAAVALGLSVETVKCHRKSVIRKLGARNSTHAVAIVAMNAPELLG